MSIESQSRASNIEELVNSVKTFVESRHNDYVEDLSDDDARDFFYNHMHAKVDLDHVDYTVEIPQAIIKKTEQ